MLKPLEPTRNANTQPNNRNGQAMKVRGRPKIARMVITIIAGMNDSAVITVADPSYEPRLKNTVAITSTLSSNAPSRPCTDQTRLL